ncbi:MAG: NAD-dependent epimerase/dehydratase family protein [Kiritimatiellaeota bacterium]|nr:NAD-dependent epimerase/dehydratase family protein [Kiritimatiellota bacterium]
MDEQEDRIPAGAKVLVTGATGFTGARLVRRLAAQGCVVRAIARHTANAGALQDVPVQWFRGDVFDHAVVRAATAGVQYVFHVAAAYRVSGLPDDEYRRVHVTSTELLAEAALRQPDFRRFVHVSTVGVHGHVAQPPASEASPFNPGDIYQQTKAEAELWLHEFARGQGLPYAVIRPAAIYGPGDRRLLKIFKLAIQPFFILLGRSQGLYHLVHVEDLLQGLLLAAVHPAAQGEAFICGNPAAVTLERMGRIIAGALGRTCRVVRLPAWPVFLAADLCEAVCKPLHIAPPLYRRRVAFFTKDRSFDTRKIRDRLGFRPRYTDEEGLAMTARWYQEHHWL